MVKILNSNIKLYDIHKQNRTLKNPFISIKRDFHNPRSDSTSNITKKVCTFYKLSLLIKSNVLSSSLIFCIKMLEYDKHDLYQGR